MDLELLEKEAKALLALLKDKEESRGLFSWNFMLKDRLASIKKLIEKAGV